MSKKTILKEIIETRKSKYPKDYTTEKISKKVLNKILKSADFAPNHKLTKPWRLELFQDDAKMELAVALGKVCILNLDATTSEKKIKNIQEKFEQTNAIVSISVNYSGKVPQWEELAATAMAVQNMYLTCNAHNVGCYWSTPKEAENLSEFLKLEDNQMCLGLFYMGKLPK
ncbi:nitroreductase family protein [Frigoriflavimonas asaccharolytica]|uniref:Nitroreductase n=1 Tax=Frigoriflavimonas asaccharolytica TaxID=2735899 RepID=A0A8J8K8X1_9FLAO|nr:nitroreductase family protein [Frigoriflavimonas asaccharolytica]NRS93318.1 nitroreductase [Frigoriflavimonas asaccharolytica]